MKQEEPSTSVDALKWCYREESIALIELMPSAEGEYGHERHPNINVWMLKLHNLNIVSVSEANTQGEKSKIFA